jgi:hypothetical protein
MAGPGHDGQTYFVVGDEYREFARNAGVVTVSGLLDLLRRADPAPVRVVLGQGLPLEVRQRMAASAQPLGTTPEAYPPAPTDRTHKTHREHVLITDVQPAGDPRERRYRCGLAIGDGHDRLGDHVTGQHLAAMLLMEAARQAVIAVLASEYPPVASGAWGLVLERLDARYFNYAFPVPTLMLTSLGDRGEPSDRQVAVVVTVEFLQADKVICQMQLDVSLRDAARLEKIESRRARQLLAAITGRPDPGLLEG